MRMERRVFLLSVTLAAATATAAMGQTATPAAGPVKLSAASIPDFSGVWRHGSLPWFEPPESGPAPVTNRSIIANGRSVFTPTVSITSVSPS